jgi:hypothetical protein
LIASLIRPASLNLSSTQPTRSPRVQARFACSSKEEIIYFRCFGGETAKTTEKDSNFHAAAGEKIPCGLSNYTDCVSRVIDNISCDFVASPQNHTKKTGSSLLPQPALSLSNGAKKP